MNNDIQKDPEAHCTKPSASAVSQGSSAGRSLELYDRAPVPYLVLLSDGQIVQSNRAAQRLLQQRSDDLYGQILHEYVSDHSQPGFAEFLKQVFQKDATVEHDIQLVRLDDEPVTVCLRGSRSEDSTECFVVMTDITERIQSTLALEESQKRYKTLIEHTPFCVHEIDLEGRVESVNRAGLQMLRVQSEQDIEGVAYLSVVRSENFSQVRQLLGRAMKGEASDFEFATRGEPSLYIKSCFIPIRDADGEVIRILGISEDVTEQKNAHDKMQRNNMLLEASQSIGRLGGWELDLSTGNLFWTAETYRIHDTSPEEFNPTVDAGLSYFLPDSRDVLKQALKVAAEEGEGYDLELETLTTKGRRIDVRTTCVVTRRDGVPYRLTGIFQDITEKKRAEVNLRESQAKLELALKAAHIGPWSWDLLTDEVYFSPEWKRQIGYAEDELTDEFTVWVDHLHPEDRERILDAVNAYRADPVKNDYSVDFRFRHKDGSYRWIHTRAILLYDSAGQAIRMLGAHLDVTERKLTEERLLRTQRLESLGTLAGGVAHDLNNALAPILMGTELLRLNYPDASETADLFEASAKRACDMSRQLLTFAKGAEGERVAVDVQHLIDEIRNLMRGTFPKNIQVEIECEPLLPKVLGEATQLHRILLNLCVNSRDAMPDGGNLKLKTQVVAVDAERAGRIHEASSGTYLEIEVQDNGVGIQTEHLDRVFEPFFSTKEPQKGTGLGLSTVMGIVKGHGGFVEVSSKPGQGTRVSVYLPAIIESPSKQSRQQRTKLSSGDGKLILVIDDEQSVRGVARMSLRQLQYQVVTAHDGVEGLQKLKEHSADIKCVIVDLHMPRMTGLDFAREARALYPELPIVVSSGRMDAAAKAKFEVIGIASFLDKPFTLVQLSDVLKTQLDVH